MIQFFKKHYILIIKILFLIGYGISIPGLWIMRENPNAYQLSWIFTTLSLLILMFFHKPLTIKFLLSLVLVGIVGWTVEAVGTNTGLIFGNYTYGKSLGPKIFETPLAMLVNWMISIYLVTMLLKSRILNPWKLSLSGASLMVFYDILLEPVAIRLDMWTWANGYPPFQNYVAWFVLSVPLIFLLQRFVKKSDNPLVFLIFICQIILFAALNLLIVFAGF